jgi:hypothetical protein
MTTQISVEIFSLKGILPTLYKENKNSLLFFKSALDNITLESSECVLSDEVIYLSLQISFILLIIDYKLGMYKFY